MTIDWDAIIGKTLDAMPREFRERMDNVAIFVEDEPDGDVRRDEGLAPGETLLGYYRGIPLSERGDGYGVGETLPDTIFLYADPIAEEAGETDGDIARVAHETLWHELGHHFGLDEEQVRALERRRDDG